jgi:ribonuclease HII
MLCAGSTTKSMPAKFDTSLLPLFPDLSIEIALWGKGFQSLAGVDEAGRGALAGPVAAGAVILPPNPGIAGLLRGVNDSKKLTPPLRAQYAARIKEIAIAWEVGMASHTEIDVYGIVAATRLAMKRAIDRLRYRPDYLLIDYLDLPAIHLPSLPLVKGDQRSLTIAAASILAKTARDIMLCQLDQHFPGYGFAEHKGYCTRAHLDALERIGPSPVHRHTFKYGGSQAELPALAQP